MTNYYTEGSMYLGGLEPGHVDTFKNLFATMDLIVASQLAGPASKQASPQPAREFFEAAEPPVTIEDVAWSQCFPVQHALSGSIVRVDVSDWPRGDDRRLTRVSALLWTVVQHFELEVDVEVNIVPNRPTILAIPADTLAQDVADFLVNLRELAFYTAIRDASGNSDELEELAWRLALDEDYWARPDIHPQAAGVGFHDSEGFNVDFMADMFQGVMKILDTDWLISMEYACTSSRPVVDGFGGGALVLNADDSTWVDSSYFANVIGPNILQGPHCPECESIIIEGGPVEIEHSMATQEGTCLNCGHAFYMKFLYQKSVTPRRDNDEST